VRDRVEHDESSLPADPRARETALRLLDLMHELSERGFCAVWLVGIERLLWQVEPGQRCGQHVVTPAEVHLLDYLSATCVGWWRWDDARGPVFTSRREFAEKLALKPSLF